MSKRDHYSFYGKDRVRVLSKNTMRAYASRRKFLAGAAGLGASVALGSHFSAVANSSSRSRAFYRAAQEEQELSIIIGTLGEASSINPWLAGDSEDEWRCKILYDEFVRINPETSEPMAGIAADWTVEGNEVITFELQPDVLFSDGSPLTAEDIEFTILGHLAPETGSPKQDRFLTIQGAQAYVDGSADSVEGIEVLDESTIRVTLGEPDAAFLLNCRYIWPVPKAHLEGDNLATSDFFQNPIGAGPFVFESWSQGADFIAVRNENFWEEGKPGIDRVTHRFVGDSQTLVLGLTNNELDGSNYANPVGREELEANTELELIVPPFGSPDGWLFNTRVEPLNDTNVRRAIAMAIDTEQFAADALLDLGGAGLGPIAPDSWAHDPDLEPIPYDPDTARQMISDAGAEGAQITFFVNAGNIMREDWLVYTQQALQNIGIEVISDVGDYATHIEAVTQSLDFEVSGVDLAGASVDPSLLYSNFHSSSAGNYSGFSTPELDELLEQAKGTFEQEDAIPIYAEIQRLLMDEVPFHWAWYRPFLHAVNTRFEGYQSTQAFGLFYFLQDWSGAPTP